MNVASIFLFGLLISIDAFSLAVCFGTKGLILNFWDCVFINIINSLTLIFSIVFAKSIFSFLKEEILILIGCGFLFALGVYNLLKFVYDLKNKKEKVVNIVFIKGSRFDYLSIVFLLCFESFISGFGALSFGKNFWFLILISFTFHTLFLFLGLFWGKKVANLGGEGVSFLSGVFFIMLAIFKFFA